MRLKGKAMRENFRPALTIILAKEAGFVNNPNDPGGATNLGITLGTARAWNLDEDHNGLVDVRDVRLLTPDIVGPVYKAGYWDTMGGDGLPGGTDLMAFDCAVNQGSGFAKRLVAHVAGELDPITTMRALRESRYRDNHNFHIFGRGWLARLAEITATSRQWEAGNKPSS